MPALDVAKINAKAGALIAFDVEGVLARLTKKQAGEDAPVRIQFRNMVEFGAIVAAAIRRRVQGQGQLAQGQTWRYSTRNTGVRMSQQYRALAGVAAHQHFASESAMHLAAGTKPGSFSVTGGMWEGLQSRYQTGRGIRIEFAGTSLGRGKEQKVGVHPKSGRAVIKTANQQVRNALKGTSIGKRGISLLALTDEDRADIVTACRCVAARRVGDAFGYEDRDLGSGGRLWQDLVFGWAQKA